MNHELMSIYKKKKTMIDETLLLIIDYSKFYSNILLDISFLGIRSLLYNNFVDLVLSFNMNAEGLVQKTQADMIYLSLIKYEDMLNYKENKTINDETLLLIIDYRKFYDDILLDTCIPLIGYTLHVV